MRYRARNRLGQRVLKWRKVFWAGMVVAALLAGGGVLIWLKPTSVHLSPYRKISAVSPMPAATPTAASASADVSENDVPTTPSHDYTVPAITDGAVPVIRSIPTTAKVAFLTIDDGIVTNPADVRLMQDTGIKATFFLVYRFINADSSFFANLAQATGSDIENHSYDHHLLPGLSYDTQRQDICQNADAFTTLFGKRPTIFRPSGGGYDTTTLKAAADCGMKALVLWDATINNGSIKYAGGPRMRPGDIVLMHFRTTFQEDLNAFVQAAKAAGLQPDLLVNWIS